MTKLRRWGDPVDPVLAERLLSRFVRSVTTGFEREGTLRPIRSTKLISSPNRPPRRGDEATATFRAHPVDPDLEEVRKRRLLGQDDLDGVLGDAERQRFVTELRALYRHGHVDDVMTELERIRSKFPNDVELHGRMVELFLERGDLARATEMLFAMVNMYFERADADAARRCLTRIKRLDPENKRLKRFEKLMAS